MVNVGVLGTGITGKAVIDVLSRISGYRMSDLDHADVIVVSPGISPKLFPNTKAEIISEVEFAYRLFHRPRAPYTPDLVGITGTNGKTTVTSIIAHFLDCPSAGNIGIPLISFVEDSRLSPQISVELSSYQLERCVEFRPKVGVFLNVTPDHLSRHHTIEEYGAQKGKLFQNQKEDDVIIYNSQDPLVTSIAKKTKARKIPFSLGHPFMKYVSNSPLIGTHNTLNCLAAMLAAIEMGCKREDLIAKLPSVLPPPPRLEK
ncbi:MAG: hypothetical protein HRT90_08925 [Candidatus Margulisbacteria bacterium]|nr:hypothetical protein [Candidatus Margulisiibacteriota bacterium]